MDSEPRKDPFHKMKVLKFSLNKKVTFKIMP